MSVIKALLVVAIVLAALWALRHRDNVGLRAGGRLLLIAIGAVGVLSVIFPAITQSAADAVGVKRGTDLVLYALIVTFVFTTASLFFHQRDLENRLAAVTRALAIHQAVAPDEIGDLQSLPPIQSEDSPSPPAERNS